jgi:hypothetical protein
MVHMAGEITKVITFPRSPNGNAAQVHKWVGKIAIFELITGSRMQGKILAVTEEWIDTDNVAVKVAAIVGAKWVNEEEARIIRGGPLGSYDPRQLNQRR